MRKVLTLSTFSLWTALALSVLPAPAQAQVTLSQAQKLLASDGSTEDRGGSSVSISGNTAVIGAPGHTDTENDQGAAYVYQRDPTTNSWSQVKKLVASDAGFDNFFGTSVAISGDRIAVGAPGNDIAFNVDQGSAYVFERDAGGLGNWGQVAEPIGTNGEASDRFGSAVAIDGDTLVVGAPFIDGSDGGFFVYQRDAGGAWLQVGRVDVSDGEFASEFGAAVAIHGDTIVAGSPEAGGGGAAWVFARDVGSEDGWSFVAELVRTPVRTNARYGGAVAVHGDTVAVGARDDDVGSQLEQGAGYLFQRDQGGTDAWGQVARVTASDGTEEDGFGAGVALRGDLLLVGVRFVSPSSPAYSFGRNQGGPNAWGQLQRLTRADGLASFGPAVALTGGVFGFDALIGAPFDDVGIQTNSGAAFVFGNTRARPDIDAVSGQIGSGSGVLLIGSVEDDEQSPQTLVARIDGGDSATSNGVTVSNLAIASDGAVTADVDVACGASDASFELSFEDEFGLVSTATLDIEAAPSDPPVLQLASPGQLWPPSPLYWPVAAFLLVESATDDCDGNLRHDVVIEQVTSDEPDDAPGLLDGRTRHDIIAPFCEIAFVRAERNLAGNGRVYGVTLRVRDSEGNETRAVFPVGVPITRRGTAVEDAPAQTVATGCP